MENDYVAEWFRFADADLASAEFLLGLQPLPMEIICYHCEQSAEKYLKGFLLYKGIIEPPKTHDLNTLCEMCSVFDERFREINRACSILTVYSVQPRYPHEMEILDSDMRQALNYARQIKDFAPLSETRQVVARQAEQRKQGC